MTNRLELNWKIDGFVDEQRYYCSEAPIDVANPPAAVAILTNIDRQYTDTTGIVGKHYYVRVSGVKNGVEKFSDEKKVFFGEPWTPQNLTNAPKIWFDADEAEVVNNRVERVLNSGALAGFAVKHLDANRPYYLAGNLNGHSVLRFDSSVLVVQNARALFKNVGYAVSLYVTKKRTNDTTAAVRQIFYSPSGAGNSRYADGYYLTPNGRGMGRRRLDNVGNTTLAGGVAIADDWEIRVCVTNWATAKASMRVNGSVVGNFETFLTAGTTSNTEGVSDPTLGAELSGSSVTSVGDIDLACALISSENALAESEIQKLEGWAAWRYGLVDKLPIDHPYKTLVPTL